MSKSSLTPRQKQIIGLIIFHGKVNKEIAVELNLAHTTVLNVTAAVFRRLKINNIRQLFPLVDQLKAEITE